MSERFSDEVLQRAVRARLQGQRGHATQHAATAAGYAAMREVLEQHLILEGTVPIVCDCGMPGLDVATHAEDCTFRRHVESGQTA